MLLRRVIQHVKTQNWFAVAIDFVIVVVGVFIGIQVSNWNAARAEAARADSYLQRLYEDVSDDIVMLAERQALWARQMQLGRAALAAKAVRPDEQERAWEIVRAFHHASNSVPLHLRDGTYADMVSAGQLGLIADTELRDRTTLYYTSSWGIDLSSIIPEYRMAVRRIIPPDVHGHLLPCHEVEPPHRHILTDCSAPADGPDLVTLANTLIEDEQLRGDLVYALSVMNTSTYIVDGVILVAATELRDRIDQALSANTNSGGLAMIKSETDRLNRWLTLAANLGVIVGLIILIVEVRQNADLTRAQLLANRDDLLAQIELSLASPESSAAWVKSIREPESLSDTEIRMVESHLVAVMLQWHHMFNMEEAGLTCRGATNTHPQYRAVLLRQPSRQELVALAGVGLERHADDGGGRPDRGRRRRGFHAPLPGRDTTWRVVSGSPQRGRHRTRSAALHGKLRRGTPQPRSSCTLRHDMPLGRDRDLQRRAE